MRRPRRWSAFTEPTDELPPHSAIALPYAHCTAPLRRLADRYVLDLLVDLESGRGPESGEVAALCDLPAIMEEAGRKSGRLERRILDVAEAWELRDRVGACFHALVLDSRGDEVDAQLEEVPVRARVPRASDGPPPRLGEEVRVKLTGVALEEGKVEFEMAGAA